MTVSTSASQTTLGGNGSQTVFAFGFVVGLASNLQVVFTDAAGSQTVLTPSQYGATLNAPVTGQLWGVGGTVTYPLAGAPIAGGTTLTISRIMPLTQQTSISNQGSFYPQAVEQAIDVLCMEIQQVAARTGQLRGTWATGIAYNYGDIVADGTNGANTGDYYLCAIANTSGTWSTDLASGDWSLVINVQQLATYAAVASASATAATASATSAAGSASMASGSATSASSSATSAASSATNAATSANSAAANATSASASASNATASAVAAAQQAAALTGTSATPLTIGTGSRSLTTGIALQFVVGEFVVIANTPTPTNYLHGQVTAYNSGTGVLTVNILDTGGSGTFSDWTIIVSGTQGPQGPAGAGGGSLTWNMVTGNTTMAANNGYLTDSTSQLQLTLPSSLTIGQRFEIDASQSAGGFLALPNTSQTINWGTTALTGTEGIVGLQGGVIGFVASSTTSVDVEFLNVASLFTQGNSNNDPFWNNVSFLVPLNTASVPTTSSDGNGIALTNSSVSMSTSQTKYGSYSASFNGSSSKLVNTSTGVLAFGPGDFTMEAWVYVTGGGGVYQPIVGVGASGGAQLVINNSNRIYLTQYGGSIVVAASVVITFNTWNHIAVTRQGGTSYLWLNGANVGSASDANIYTASSLYIGNDAASDWFSGYMTQVRVTKGVARYTAQFAPPAIAFLTAEDTADDPVWNRTVLQLPFESTANDQSGNAVALTNNGSTPFSSSVVKVGSYSAGLFNGSSQYFNNTTATSFGTGDFTLEGWLYPTANGESGITYICGAASTSGSVMLGQTPSALTVGIYKIGTGAVLTSSSSMTLDAWNHIAAVRSGGVDTIYINGIASGTVADTNSYPASNLQLGSANGTANSFFNGYLDNIRVSAFPRYTANFTPPVATYQTALPTAYDPFWQSVTFMPRAAVGNSISDLSGNGLVITNAGTTTSNSTTEQDAYSAVFNGSSSNLQIGSPGTATQFSGDFTVECYVWFASLSPMAQVFFDTRATTGNDTTGFCLLTRSSTQKFGFYYGTSGTDALLSTSTLSAATWYHLAVVRYAGIITMYVNGSAQGTLSNSTNFSDGNLAVGSQTTGAGGGVYFDGNIAGLRVTKAARYTATFSPPSNPFLTNGAT